MSIKTAREAIGYSQKDLAEIMHVSQPTVCDWEKGRKYPAGKNLLRLSEILKCSTDFILTPDDYQRPISGQELKMSLFGTLNIDDAALSDVLQYAEYIRSKYVPKA